MTATTRRMLPLFLAFTLFLAPVARTQLVCYVCDDCDEVNNNTNQMTCESITTPAPTTETTTPTTTTETTTPTTTTETTTPTTTTEPTIPTTTTETPTTTTETPTTTTETPTTTTETPTTTTETPTTTTETPTTTTETTTTTTAPTPPSDVENKGFLNAQPIVKQVPHERFLRSVRQTTFRCVKAVYIDGGVTKTNRGCMAVQPNDEDEAVCQRSVGEGSVIECGVCDSNLCNPAARALISSAALLLPVLTALAFLH